ncbi:MAG: hypothetical protein AAF525_12135 [Pseudomonadota bacterium]
MEVVDPDAVHTEIAMQVLDRMIPDILDQNGPAVRARFDNALLNLAVNRLVAAEGTSTAATILWRLADVIQSGVDATPDKPADLTSCQG